jgi:hypothetical protein
MAYDKYGVVKVKGDPEVFWIILFDSTMAKGRSFMSTSDDMDDAGVRAELIKMGDTTPHVDTLLAAARADWDAKHT